MFTLRPHFARLATLLLLGTLVLAACAPTASPGSITAPASSAGSTSAPSALPTTGAIVAPTVISPTTGALVTPGGGPAQAPAMPPASIGDVTIAVKQNATLGHFITDGKQRTLYIFMKDTQDASNCNDACAKTWPPLTVTDKPTAMNGLDDTLLGTIKRQDGTMQVTFNGYPLYYYSNDQNPGDTKGQGIGGNWYVISISGDPVK